MKDKTTTKTFVSFDPEFIEVVGMTPAVLLGFIRFRTAGRQAVVADGKRWARVTIADIAETLHLSTNTAKRAFKALANAGLVETRPDGHAGMSRLVACDARAIEEAAPGCWLASQLEEDMCRPAAGIPDVGALPGQPASAGAGTAGPGVSKVPKRRFESPKMVPSRSQNGTSKVPKWYLESPKMVPSDSEETVTNTTSDLRFFDQDHPFVPTLKKIEKKERKKEEEKEKETMEQIYIALLQDYVEPEPYVPIATNLNSVAVDTSADPAAFDSDSLTAPTLDTEPDVAEVGIKADATSALSGVNSETENDTAAFAGLVAGIAANLTANSKSAAMQRQISTRPSPADVNAYLAVCGARDVGFDGHAFCADMDARGWTAENGSPIRNWQMAVTQRALMARVRQMPAYQAQAA